MPIDPQSMIPFLCGPGHVAVQVKIRGRYRLAGRSADGGLRSTAFDRAEPYPGLEIVDLDATHEADAARAHAVAVKYLRETGEGHSTEMRST